MATVKKSSGDKKLAITWKASAIGRAQVQKDTVKALGLKKLNQTVIKADNPAIRGMIKKITHLLEVKDA
ncbi:MAG: 50S ribosomal protein L30 [Firmicutes bacterium]|nr:50S ribosomal protein L30 [Bacillota bacterium]